MQRDRGAFQVVTRAVGTVINVEDVGQSAHRPGGVRFVPDGLAESEGGTEGRWCPDEHHVAADRARVVVHHCREPRPLGFAACGHEENVELGVVGLPGLIRALCTAAVDQLVSRGRSRGPLEPA